MVDALVVTQVTLVPNVEFAGINLFMLLIAATGGFIGAAIGANMAFGFTGIAILLGFGVAAGTGSDFVLSFLAFGPIFGPHVCFAGGAAATAYAARIGVQETGGKDINVALAKYGRPDVLLVGSLFGMGGYILERLIALIPWFGQGHTDTVALTVVISGIVVRLVFGNGKPFEWVSKLEGNVRWLQWQEKPSQYLSIAALFSLAASSIVVIAHHGLENAPVSEEAKTVIMNNIHTLPFALSAVCIIMLVFGAGMPVTHHMTIIAAVAANVFFPLVGNDFLVIIIGVIFGMIAASLAEVAAHLSYDKGDTHIDPPAAVIWLCTTLVHITALPFLPAV